MLIIASTRPGRAGLPIGQWFEGVARQHGGFDLDVVDLAELNLPFMDEPNHPRLRQYTRQHTKDWSVRVAAADAFVIVTPEYNHGFPAPLKNAIDYLLHEWAFKPVGFVSYGGVAAGTRAVQMFKPVADVLKLTAVPEAVAIPFFQRFMTDDGAFQLEEGLVDAARVMLNELARWVRALRPLRAPVAQPA
jgi:NAD(P)H-dependent FMN reductase